MKTTLLHLEPHDDLISVRDRMSWAKTPRILLIWPRRGRDARQVDIRSFDLMLLRRHAAALGAQLALVTRQSDIRNVAHDLQIPCFSSLPKAQEQPWQTAPILPLPARRQRNLRQMRAALPGDLFALTTPARVGVFSLGVAALLLILLLLIPAAQIRLTTTPQPQQIEFFIKASQRAGYGQLPVRPLSLDLEISASAAASGQITFPGQRAEATVFLTNLTAAPVNVPAATLLLAQASPAIVFETLAAVSVEKTAEVRVRALQGGESGNVPAASIRAFQNMLGLSLSVTNPQPASGGDQKTEPAPSQVDREELRATILRQMQAQAPAQFSSSLETGDLLLAESVKLTEILREEFSPLPGTPGKELSLRLRGRFEAFFVSQADLSQAASQALDAALPPGFAPRPGSLELTALSAPAATEDGYRWRMRAARAIQPQLDLAQAALLARGQTPRRAAALLAQIYPLAEAPAIVNQPIWWPWLPFLPMRITVTTNFP